MDLPEYWLPRPADEPTAQAREAFDDLWERVLARGGVPVIDDELPAPKWQFLNHLADVHGLALHGSGNPGIDLFEPRQAQDLREFGNQRAVFAAADGIWAMFFAVADRDHIGSVTNACVRLADVSGRVSQPLYVFSISRSASPDRAWRRGTVYILPSDTFTPQPDIPFGEYQVRIPQLASTVPVKPLARVTVEPADFPFLAQVRRHDDDRLEVLSRALESGAPWPT